MPMKDLYDKNSKCFKKEIKEDIRNWKDLPSSEIWRINIIKMANLPKAIYNSMASTNKIPIQFVTHNDRLFSTPYAKTKPTKQKEVWNNHEQ